MKVRKWGRVVAYVCVIAAVVVAGGFLWRQARGSGGTLVQARGWPERIRLVCLRCAHGFQVASKDYLADMQVRSEGGEARLCCPACQSEDILRPEHLAHQQHRFEDGIGNP